MSVHSWGEDPRGTWRLEVFNDAEAHSGLEARFYSWSLQLFGTQSDPNPVAKMTENSERTRSGKVDDIPLMSTEQKVREIRSPLNFVSKEINLKSI